MHYLTPEDVQSLSGLVEHRTGEIVHIYNEQDEMPSTKVINLARYEIQCALEMKIQDSVIVSHMPNPGSSTMSFYCYMKKLPKLEHNEELALIPNLGSDITEKQLEEICERLADHSSTMISITRERDTIEECFFDGIMAEIQRYTESTFETPMTVRLQHTEDELRKEIYICFEECDPEA
jgi:hypothetical protein